MKLGVDFIIALNYYLHIAINRTKNGFVIGNINSKKMRIEHKIIVSNPHATIASQKMRIDAEFNYHQKFDSLHISLTLILSLLAHHLITTINCSLLNCLPHTLKGSSVARGVR